MVPTGDPVKKVNLLVFETAGLHPKSVSVLLDKPLLQTILHRALNTWSDVPPELMRFSDQIDKL